MAAGTMGTTVTAVVPPQAPWRRMQGYSPISRSSPSNRARQPGKDSTASA